MSEQATNPRTDPVAPATDERFADGTSTEDRFARFQDADRDGPRGTANEVIDGPVADYATDFDHTADEWVADPYPIIDDLRERCPVARTERYGGGWLPTRHEDVAAIAYDTDRFSSRSVVMNNNRPPHEIAPRGIAPPISSDPPFHKSARRLLLPAFAPQAIARLEDGTRSYCEELLDAIEARMEREDDDVVDAAGEFAQHIPVRVIAAMLGFPLEDAELHRGFVHDVLEGVNLPIDQRFERMKGLFAYLEAQVQDHVAHPRDDLTTYLIEAELDGEQLDAFHIAGTMALLLLAGIDTTWSAIGASIWHLAGHPDDRERLVAEPDLLPTAMEEFLRAYAPVTMARLVKDDMEWNGCPMKADDWILLSFPAANRDPEMFERADEVIIDREVNRHAAFGLGVHRCLGSHLARMELKVALETWLARFPEFSLADPGAVTWSEGQVRGPRHLPVAIGR
jgi:cytochrome P450